MPQQVHLEQLGPAINRAEARINVLCGEGWRFVNLVCNGGIFYGAFDKQTVKALDLPVDTDKYGTTSKKTVRNGVKA